MVNQLDVIKKCCVDNPEIDDIPKLRTEFAKKFHEIHPIKFKIRTTGYYLVDFCGTEKN